MLTVSEPIINLLSWANQKSKKNGIGIQIVKFVEALHAVSSSLDCYIYGVPMGDLM